ncbi:MAG TPA: hypothetical protein VE571_12620 [Solirubrobacteraceae bacterium]|nr:hypothetical protein [Solirubrobacteraceae bacterium]
MAADTLLGVYGPLGLLTVLGTLSLGVVVSFAGLHWAVSTHLGGTQPAGFLEDLYYSAGTFVSASTPDAPSDAIGKVLQIACATGGFAVLFIAIGYLPALFQAFSGRETAVSRLDARAGSPPCAATLLERSGMHGGWHELSEYLREWEPWAAELMETHLSYPILGYFRSQHVNQNWLAALTTVVDASAYALAYGPKDCTAAAELTFRVGRHSLADLAYAFTQRRGAQPTRPAEGRLTPDGLRELQALLEGSGLHSEPDPGAAERLNELRGSYEPFAVGIAHQLALRLPGWLPDGEVRDNWRASTGHHHRIAP